MRLIFLLTLLLLQVSVPSLFVSAKKTNKGNGKVTAPTTNQKNNNEMNDNIKVEGTADNSEGTIASMDPGIKRRNTIARIMRDNKKGQQRRDRGVLVYLSDLNFSTYIIERPRIYTAVVMFTALMPSYECSVCADALTPYQQAANHYASLYNFSAVDDSKQMVFFIIDAHNSMKTFADMGIMTIPHIYVLPPRERNSAKLKLSDFELSMVSTMESQKAMLQQLTKLSGIKIEVALEPLPVIAGLCIVSTIVAFIIALAGSTDILSAILWYQKKFLWITISMACFIVGVSGSIYCIIRSAPKYGYNKQGQVEIFATMGREQYIGEGIIVSLWSIGCGLCGAVLYYSSNLKRFPIFRHAISLLSITCLILLFTQIWNAYLEKTSWYSLKETIPSELWAYLSSPVKKNSGLVKRCLRISEIFLFEYKDWNSFRDKAKIMVIDYAIRLGNETLSAFVNSTISKM